jgi:hypothetical protein
MGDYSGIHVPLPFYNKHKAEIDVAMKAHGHDDEIEIDEARGVIMFKSEASSGGGFDFDESDMPSAGVKYDEFKECRNHNASAHKFLLDPDFVCLHFVDACLGSWGDHTIAYGWINGIFYGPYNPTTDNDVMVAFDRKTREAAKDHIERALAFCDVLDKYESICKKT